MKKFSLLFLVVLATFTINAQVNVLEIDAAGFFVLNWVMRFSMAFGE